MRVECSQSIADTCMGLSLFFLSRVFFYFSSLSFPPPNPSTVKTYARGAICYSFFFFFIPEAEKQRERDKYQRENERHKLAS